MIKPQTIISEQPVTHLTQFEYIDRFQILARLVRRELNKLTRPNNAGSVSVKSLRFKSFTDQVFMGFVEIDTRRLPPGVTHQKLVHPELLRHLTMVLGCPVHKINTTGLTYRLTLLDERPAITNRLPGQVRLDIADIPPGLLMIPFGLAATGPLWQPLDQVVGMLVGGNPRTGKSTYLNVLLLTLAHQHTPAQLQLALVDPKAVEFSQYQAAQLLHLLAPIAVEPPEIVNLIERLSLEIDQRKGLFTQHRVKNLAEFNRSANHISSAELPAILLVIDEFADLMDEFSGKTDPVLKLLKRVIRMGPAFGLYTIIATQRPDALSLDTTIRSLLPTRVALSVSDTTASKMILGCPLPEGAERIGHHQKGRMLVKLPDGQMQLAQGFTAPEKLTAILTDGSITSAPSLLTGPELAMIKWAIYENDNYLTINNFQMWLSLSAHQAGRQVKQWRLKGWLEKDPNNNNAHCLTTTLLNLVDVSDTSDT